MKSLPEDLREYLDSARLCESQKVLLRELIKYSDRKRMSVADYTMRYTKTRIRIARMLKGSLL